MKYPFLHEKKSNVSKRQWHTYFFSILIQTWDIAQSFGVYSIEQSHFCASIIKGACLIVSGIEMMNFILNHSSFLHAIEN